MYRHCVRGYCVDLQYSIYLLKRIGGINHYCLLIWGLVEV